MANLPMENFHGIEVVFIVAGPVGLLVWLLRMISEKEGDRVIQVLLQCGIFLLTLNMLEKVNNNSNVWWFVLVLGILSYTALQSFAESGSGGLSDDVEWKADRTDVEDLQREVEDLRDEIYHLRVGRDRANKGVYEPEETTKDLQTGWQLQEESNDVMWEHLGQEAELRSLREAVEKLKEEMAFLKVAEDSAYERDVSDKKS